jgi:hypothetical protein
MGRAGAVATTVANGTPTTTLRVAVGQASLTVKTIS